MEQNRFIQLKSFSNEFLCGYQFNHWELLDQALTTKDCGESCDCGHNQVLEFYGDEGLDFFVSRNLSMRFSSYSDVEDNFFVSYRDEGQLTELKAALVKGDYLAKRGFEIGLGDLIYASENEDKQGLTYKPKALREAMESIIGALLFDMGFFGDLNKYNSNFVRKMDNMDSIIESLIDIQGFFNELVINTLKDYPKKVREWCQKCYGEEPVVEKSQNYWQKTYKVSISIPDYDTVEYSDENLDIAIYRAYFESFKMIVENGDYVIGKYQIFEELDNRPLFFLKNNLSKFFGKKNTPQFSNERDGDGIWHTKIYFPFSKNTFKGESETKKGADNVAALKAVRYFVGHPELDVTENKELFEY